MRNLLRLALSVLLICGPGYGQAQDAGLAFRQGQPDLALFALTGTETRVSSAGRALPGLQGFLHDPAGPALQPLSSGHALMPLLRHDTNVNGGIPSDRITIGGLPFRVFDDSRARSGVLMGLRYAGWQSLSFGRAARLRLSHSYSAEAEPKHGFHRLSAWARACADRPLQRWTWVEGCLSGFYDDDSVDAETAVTSQIGMRRLFRTPLGFHQAQVTLARTHQDDYRKDAIHLTSHTLTKAGLFGLDVSLGERVTGQNTLRTLVAASWSGTLGRQPVTLRLSRACTTGAMFLGAAREDRITRAKVETPLSILDLGLYAEERQSTIDAYGGTDVGIDLGLRINLLK
ncbi:hypothetical protein [Paracoccus sediminilitoris]|uniref:hypothetical protein n=1 Tax=Paracoccus sediminilitoris TaxID=2202419 RepID=UPI00272981FD|nr:hypothetical protein [Paracoccus sediminilitoris]